MTVKHIQQYQLDAVWPDVKDMINKALAWNNGEMDLSQVRLLLSKNMCELFVSYADDKATGAAVVEFVNYPNIRAANVLAIGGRGVINEWGEFKQWMKAGGASVIEGQCRQSIARLWKSKLGMDEVSILMRATI